MGNAEVETIEEPKPDQHRFNAAEKISEDVEKLRRHNSAVRAFQACAHWDYSRQG